MDTNPKDRKSIETLQNSLEKKSKEVKASLGQNKPAPATKTKPKPAPTPTGNTKPKGDVNKDKAAPKDNVVKPTKRTDPSKFNLKPFPTK
jgi:hypothetical protein